MEIHLNTNFTHKYPRFFLTCTFILTVSNRKCYWLTYLLIFIKMVYLFFDWYFKHTKTHLSQIYSTQHFEWSGNWHVINGNEVTHYCLTLIHRSYLLKIIVPTIIVNAWLLCTIQTSSSSIRVDFFKTSICTPFQRFFSLKIQSLWVKLVYIVNDRIPRIQLCFLLIRKSVKQVKWIVDWIKCSNSFSFGFQSFYKMKNPCFLLTNLYTSHIASVTCQSWGIIWNNAQAAMSAQLKVNVL